MIIKPETRETSTVPTYFCHKTESEVKIPNVTKPCFKVNKKVDGKKDGFLNLIPKYATKMGTDFVDF